MKTKFGAIVAAGVCLSALSMPLAAKAQSGAPSQTNIEKSLRPIPSVLQGGHQGLPTAGSIARPDTGAAVAAPSAQSRNEVDADRPMRRNRAGSTSESAAHPRSAAAVVDASSKPSISIQNIQFEFGSAKLKPESIETLRNLGNALNQGLDDQKLFLIEGHTDAVGTRVYNLELSRLRAQAVKEFLVNEMAVEASRLEVVGKGSAEPANRRNPYASENRRVVVVNEAG
jgi:outer membrane protein OmpA-like peptidoglycan-associated protein